MTQSEDTQAAEALFEQIYRERGLVAFVRSLFGLGFMTGFNSRIYSNRVKALRQTHLAQLLEQGLAGLSARGLSSFSGLASVNKDQAEAAFRFTAIVNFTAPVTVLVIINQIVEGGFLSVLETASPSELLVLIAVVVSLSITVIGLLFYAYVGAQTARDVLHLVQLEQARRGGFGVMEAQAGDVLIDPNDL